MRPGNTLLQSLLTGIIISCILIFFQIVFSADTTSHNHASDNHEKFIKYETKTELPVDTKNEAKFSAKSCSLPSTGNIEICREPLCIFEILFSVNINLDQYQVSLPLPLPGYLLILFTSAISVNAP
jgi:hypothetical protein